MKMVKEVVLVNIYGMMVRHILENLLMELLMDMVRWISKMEIHIWENGRTDWWVGLVISHGNNQKKNMLGNIKKIKKMDLEFINFLMEGSILVIFTKDCLMVKLYYKKRII